MLLALENKVESLEEKFFESNYKQFTRELLIHTWKIIAGAWECSKVVDDLKQMAAKDFPLFDQSGSDLVYTLDGSNSGKYQGSVSGICIDALAENQHVQELSGLDSETIQQKLHTEWTVKGALEALDDQFSLQGGGSAIAPMPLIKLSPQLMQVENLSLTSVARSFRGVGAGDLRDALQGSSATSTEATKFEPTASKRSHKTSLVPSVKRRPSIGRVSDSPDAVRELFASIGLHKEHAKNKLKPPFSAYKSGNT